MIDFFLDRFCAGSCLENKLHETRFFALRPWFGRREGGVVEGGFRASGDDANIESPFLLLPFATKGEDDNEIAPEKKETFTFWIPS